MTQAVYDSKAEVAPPLTREQFWAALIVLKQQRGEPLNNTEHKIVVAVRERRLRENPERQVQLVHKLWAEPSFPRDDRELEEFISFGPRGFWGHMDELWQQGLEQEMKATKILTPSFRLEE